MTLSITVKGGICYKVNVMLSVVILLLLIVIMLSVVMLGVSMLVLNEIMSRVVIQLSL